MPKHGKVHGKTTFSTRSGDTLCGLNSETIETIEVPDGKNPTLYMTCKSCKRNAGLRIARGLLPRNSIRPVKINYIPGHWMSDWGWGDEW